MCAREGSKCVPVIEGEMTEGQGQVEGKVDGSNCMPARAIARVGGYVYRLLWVGQGACKEGV